MTTSEPSGTEAFHDFEQAGWERAARFYVDSFGPLTVQAAPALLDAVHAGSGTRFLDVACGPGFVAAAAAGRGADVTGLDFASAMIDEASRRHPGVAFRQGDAEELSFEDDRFDAITMNFGMLHLARPDAAIAEARRVLRRGGRYAFTVWAGRIVPSDSVWPCARLNATATARFRCRKARHSSVSAMQTTPARRSKLRVSGTSRSANCRSSGS